jgi:hypothetical protein
MLRFYHIVWSGGCHDEKCAQGPKGVDVHMRRGSRSESATCSGIEHPGRHFQKCAALVLINAADEHDRTMTIPLALNGQFLPVLRMPPIQQLSGPSFMGVDYLGCTMANGPTAAWATERRTSLPECWNPQL